MSGFNDGGPAFPTPNGGEWGFNSENENVFCRDVAEGMSLRDWFAGQALTGLLASGHFTLPNEERENDGAWMTTHPQLWEENGEPAWVGKRAFDFPEAAWACADAMLRERNRKEESK